MLEKDLKYYTLVVKLKKKDYMTFYIFYILILLSLFIRSF